MWHRDTEVSKRRWRKDTTNLAQRTVATNLPFVKTTKSVKHNKGKHNAMRRACFPLLRFSIVSLVVSSFQNCPVKHVYDASLKSSLKSLSGNASICWDFSVGICSVSFLLPAAMFPVLGITSDVSVCSGHLGIKLRSSGIHSALMF